MIVWSTTLAFQTESVECQPHKNPPPSPGAAPHPSLLLQSSKLPVSQKAVRTKDRVREMLGQTSTGQPDWQWLRREQCSPGLTCVSLSKSCNLPPNRITIGQQPQNILPSVFLKTYPWPLVAVNLLFRLHKIDNLWIRRWPGYKKYLSFEERWKKKKATPPSPTSYHPSPIPRAHFSSSPRTQNCDKGFSGSEDPSGPEEDIVRDWGSSPIFNEDY